MNVDKFGRMSTGLHRKHGLGNEDIHFTDSHLDVMKRRITNIENPIEGGDAVNKVYLEERILLLASEVTKQNFANRTATNEKIFKLQQSVEEIHSAHFNMSSKDETLVNVSVLPGYFKDELRLEKNKLINILLDYILDKQDLSHSAETKKNEEYLSVSDLVALLERWRS